MEEQKVKYRVFELDEHEIGKQLSTIYSSPEPALSQKTVTTAKFRMRNPSGSLNNSQSLKEFHQNDQQSGSGGDNLHYDFLEREQDIQDGELSFEDAPP